MRKTYLFSHAQAGRRKPTDSTYPSLLNRADWPAKDLNQAFGWKSARGLSLLDDAALHQQVQIIGFAQAFRGVGDQPHE
jgi:hypothetical protein